MKEIFTEYAAYNLWANTNMLERIGRLSDGQVNTEIASSFSTIRKTVIHMWHAEFVWWQRVQHVKDVIYLGETFTGSYSEAASGLLAQSREWKAWVEAVDEGQLLQSISFVRFDMEFTMKIHEVLLHFCNHATFHRGQLVTMLRQLGETDKIPSTDFSVYCRSRKLSQ
ncbi:DinB family protein [Ferruginibacter sp.]